VPEHFRSTSRAARAGAARSRCSPSGARGEDDGTPSSIWYVDVGKPGTVCLAGGERVRLWRNAPEGDATYLLRADGGGSHTVTFADGDTLAPWDTKLLPVTNGAVFHIASPSGGPDKELSVVLLDQVAEEPEALAAQLIENGCANQLELLSKATLIEPE
jgi:hypothetical protein